MPTLPLAQASLCRPAKAQKGSLISVQSGYSMLSTTESAGTLQVTLKSLALESQQAKEGPNLRHSKIEVGISPSDFLSMPVLTLLNSPFTVVPEGQADADGESLKSDENCLRDSFQGMEDFKMSGGEILPVGDDTPMARDLPLPSSMRHTQSSKIVAMTAEPACTV